MGPPALAPAVLSRTRAVRWCARRRSTRPRQMILGRGAGGFWMRERGEAHRPCGERGRSPERGVGCGAVAQPWRIAGNTAGKSGRRDFRASAKFIFHASTSYHRGCRVPLTGFSGRLGRSWAPPGTGRRAGFSFLDGIGGPVGAMEGSSGLIRGKRGGAVGMVRERPRPRLFRVIPAVSHPRKRGAGLSHRHGTARTGPVFPFRCRGMPVMAVPSAGSPAPWDPEAHFGAQPRYPEADCGVDPEARFGVHPRSWFRGNKTHV